MRSAVAAAAVAAAAVVVSGAALPTINVAVAKAGLVPQCGKVGLDSASRVL